MTAFRFKSATAEEAGFSASALGELDDYFDTMVANGELPGQVMLLARGDMLVHAHVTGFADCRDRRPLDADAIFTLFSMSKPLAAVAMLLLHEEGRWQFDDPVSDYLPEFADIASLPGSKATRARSRSRSAVMRRSRWVTNPAPRGNIASRPICRPRSSNG